MTEDEVFDQKVAQADLLDRVAAFRRHRDDADRASSWRGTRASTISRQAEAPPSVCLIDGELAAFYRGKMNLIYGKNDAFKTWLAYWVVVERIKAGEVGIIIDYEMGERSVRNRLSLLGATDADLERCLVVCPVVGLTDEAREVLDASVRELGGKVGVIVFDSAAASIMSSGLDANSAPDVEEWTQQGPRWAARHWPTAAVLVIDHLPKLGREPTGSRRKGDTSDAVFFVESVRRISEAEFGHSKVTVTKDRQGKHPYRVLFCFEGGGDQPWGVRLPTESEIGSSGSRGGEDERRDMIYDVIVGAEGHAISVAKIREALKGRGAGSTTQIGDSINAMVAEEFFIHPKNSGILPGPKFEDY